MYLVNILVLHVHVYISMDNHLLTTNTLTRQNPHEACQTDNLHPGFPQTSVHLHIKLLPTPKLFVVYNLAMNHRNAKMWKSQQQGKVKR